MGQKDNKPLKMHSGQQLLDFFVFVICAAMTPE